MPTYESKKNLLAENKTLRQKKEYYKISRELDSLKNTHPDYVLWIPDEKLSSNEKEYKKLLVNQNQTSGSQHIRYVADKISKLTKLVNRTH